MKRTDTPNVSLIVRSVLDASSPVAAFRALGGRIRFIGGANVARCAGVGGSSTVSEVDAVKSWARAVERRATS